MRAQLIMAILMISLHRRVLDRSVHSFDLTIGPRMVWLSQAMLDTVRLADHVEAHLPCICCVPVARLLGELDAVVRQNRVDAIGDRLEQTFEEFPRSLAIRLIYELRDGKFAGPVNAHKEIELAFNRLHLGDIDMKEADGLTLELLPLWLVALDVRQARDAVPLKATMER